MIPNCFTWFSDDGEWAYTYLLGRWWHSINLKTDDVVHAPWVKAKS